MMLVLLCFDLLFVRWIGAPLVLLIDILAYKKKIKGDVTKHISPKLFFTHDLQKTGDISIQQIRSSDNLADLFMKALPTATF